MTNALPSAELSLNPTLHCQLPGPLCPEGTSGLWEQMLQVLSSSRATYLIIATQKSQLCEH